MNDLPLEILEAVLMRSFLLLYLVDYETEDYVQSTTDDGLPYITAKFRRVEHRPFTLLSSVCWSWYQTLVGWPQSPTPAWVRHQLKKLIKCECRLLSALSSLYVRVLILLLDICKQEQWRFITI